MMMMMMMIIEKEAWRKEERQNGEEHQGWQPYLSDVVRVTSFFSSPFSRTTWRTFEENVLLIIYLDSVSSKIFPNSKVETRIDFRDNIPRPEVYVVGNVLLWIRKKKKKWFRAFTADEAPTWLLRRLILHFFSTRTKQVVPGENMMWKERKKKVWSLVHDTKANMIIKTIYTYIYYIYTYVDEQPRLR